MDYLLPVSFVEILAAVIAQEKLRKPGMQSLLTDGPEKTLTRIENHRYLVPAKFHKQSQSRFGAKTECMFLNIYMH